MKTVLILDDIYWKKIYNELIDIFPNYNFPVKDNIKDPLFYLDYIIKEQPDYILLDNRFINNDLEEKPLGARLLHEINKKLTHEEKITYKKFLFFKKEKIIINNKKIKSKIISISDNWERLKNIPMYSKYVKHYITTKKWIDLKPYIG